MLTLELSEESAEGARRREREVEVVTHDICAGGFAFVFRHFILEVTLVRARFDIMPNTPILTGVVCNFFLRGGTPPLIALQLQRR